MVQAIKQIVTVQPGGVIEVRSPELRPGDEAEVIVLVDAPPSMAASAAERVALWKRLQESVNLSPEAAEAWAKEAREERKAFGP